MATASLSGGRTSAPRTNLILLPDIELRATRADAVTAGVAGAGAAAAAVAGTRAELHVRVANPRAGRLREELEAGLRADVATVLLAETALAQDLRDADVELRRQELRLGLTPGRFGLIPELDSAAALARLPQLLAAVDRLVSVGLDLESVAASLGAPDATAATLQQPLLAQVAVTATAARLRWTVAAMGFDAGARAALASRARALGAAGVYVSSESEVAGLNALFSPAR